MLAKKQSSFKVFLLRNEAIDQWFPTFFDAFLPWLILELFIPPLLHNFSRVAEKV